MHPESWEWVEKAARRCVPEPAVLELGGRNVNGSNRPAFPGATRYHSVDLYEGPEVDEVADALSLGFSPVYDAVVCTNVLEHSARWWEFADRAYEALRDGGHFVVTTVDARFPQHSGIDGYGLRPDEHYGSIALADLCAALVTAGFEIVDSAALPDGTVCAVGVKH